MASIGKWGTTYGGKWSWGGKRPGAQERDPRRRQPAGRVRGTRQGPGRIRGGWEVRPGQLGGNGSSPPRPSPGRSLRLHVGRARYKESGAGLDGVGTLRPRSAAESGRPGWPPEAGRGRPPPFPCSAVPDSAADGATRERQASGNPFPEKEGRAPPARGHGDGRRPGGAGGPRPGPDRGRSVRLRLATARSSGVGTPVALWGDGRSGPV